MPYLPMLKYRSLYKWFVLLAKNEWWIHDFSSALEHTSLQGSTARGVTRTVCDVIKVLPQIAGKKKEFFKQQQQYKAFPLQLTSTRLAESKKTIITRLVQYCASIIVLFQVHVNPKEALLLSKRCSRLTFGNNCPDFLVDYELRTYWNFRWPPSALRSEKIFSLRAGRVTWTFFQCYQFKQYLI